MLIYTIVYNEFVNPQELHQAYSREAEILGSSLRDGAVARAEIIAEVAALADIALLCESMVGLFILHIRGVNQETI